MTTNNNINNNNAEAQVKRYINSMGLSVCDFKIDYAEIEKSYQSAAETARNCLFNEQALWDTVIEEYLENNGYKRHYVTFHVDGTFTACVFAKDSDTAEKAAEECFSNADFGALEIVDGFIIKEDAL